MGIARKRGGEQGVHYNDTGHMNGSELQLHNDGSLKASEYRHAPLPTQIETIRLLQLFPPCWDLPAEHTPQSTEASHRCGTPPGSLKHSETIPYFDLKAVALAKAPRYEAVSYTWGCTDLVRRVLVGDRYMSVTENCYQTLCRLRPRCTAIEGACSVCPRTLWIDAICIDQTSLEERTRQVRIMSAIYTRARVVLLWAGSLNEDSLSSHSIQPARGKRPTRDLPRCPSDEDLEQHTPEYLFEWINKSYFDRMWPVQEIAFSRSCLILVGEHHSIDLETLIESPQLVIDAIDGVQNSRSLYDTIERRMRLHRRLWTEFRYLHKQHLGLTRGDLPKISQILLDARHLKASEPRDKIFALQGMFEALTVKMSAPDYTKSIEDVYREATIAAINHDQSLAILEGLDTERYAQLPSWVPDFSTGSHTNNVAYAKYGPATSGSEEEFHLKLEDRTLHLRGYPLDVIDRVLAIFPDMHTLRDDVMLECVMDPLHEDAIHHSSYASLLGSLLSPFPFNVSRHVSSLRAVFNLLSWPSLDRNTEARHMLNEFSSQENFAPLRGALRSVLSRKKMFVTQDKRFGLVSSHDVFVGDHIVLLAGCCFPMVIRRDGRQWSIVAPAFVESNDSDGGRCMAHDGDGYSTNYSYSGSEKQQLIMRGHYWKWLCKRNVPLEIFDFV